MQRVASLLFGIFLFAEERHYHCGLAYTVEILGGFDPIILNYYP